MTKGAYHRNIEVYADYDPESSNQRKLDHEANIAANDRFVAAMAKAHLKGNVSVRPGVYVDLSEPIYHKRIRPELSISACGSPGAMCIESGGAADGAQTMKC